MEINKTNTAIVSGVSLPISKKMSVEICKYIKNKELNKARILLKEINTKKRALPITRFNMDKGHKPGIAAGRYPIKATAKFIELLNSLEKNAENKGLNTKSLIITFAKADKAERKWKPSRKGRKIAKNTHVEIHAEENKGESK